MGEGKKTQTSKSKGRKSAKPSVSRSTRAELQFPVSRVDHFLRKGKYSPRMSSSAPVFFAGVLEYLASNILEQAGIEAQNSGRKRISPNHLQTIINKNEHLRQPTEEEPTPESPETPDT